MQPDRGAELAVASAGGPVGGEARLWRALRLLSAPGRAAAADGETDARIRELAPAPGRLESLVVEFDEAYTAFVEGFETLPEESAMIAIQSVDARLSSMVRSADPSLWTERARRESPEWEDVRSLAARAIRALGWPEEA